MNTFAKLALSFLFVIAVLPALASAWHCVDTDQSRPAWNGTIHGYGPWGDNALLGGTSTGFLDRDVPLPEGCTGTKVRSGGHFYYKDVVCEDKCDDSTLVEYYCTDRPYHSGETIMKWTTYEGAEECSSNDVPEFNAFAAVAVGIGTLGALLFFRKK